ncbi:MAG: radical SAM protein [Candidatus Omnitrophica bacterium]|nr:radical SAM protein [Candidatus Omnitrophota bacterium]
MPVISSVKAAAKKIREEGIREGVSYIKKRAVSKWHGYPHTISFEAAAACNLRCAFCYIYKNPLVCKRPLLPLATFQKVIAETDHFLEEVMLHWRGDPLLNKELPAMVRFASERGVRPGFSTNGVLLNGNTAKELIDGRLNRIILCLDGITKDVYDAHRCGGDFDAVIENINRLVSLKRMSHSRLPIVQLQMVVTKKNQHQIEGFEQLARKLGADSAHIMSLFIDRTAPEDFVRAMEDEFFVATDKTGFARYFRDDKGAIQMYNVDTPCPQDARYPIISTDGDLVICCYDIFIKDNFGNCEKEPFTKLWNAARFRDFRGNVMMKRKLGICKNCMPKYMEWSYRLF